jgi:hypothetical protein
MRLTRNRTLVVIFIMAVGFTLIFALGFGLGSLAIIPGALILAIGVYYTFKSYARLP